MATWKLEALEVELENKVSPPGGGAAGPSRSRHLFDPKDVLAINASLASGRPLLVRGEAGIGKSQLARAAATGLRRRFVSAAVDARTEAQDLQWTFDAVRRLADAQLLGSTGARLDESQKLLDEKRYLSPGPLWWGFDWAGAAQQAKQAKTTFPVGAGDAEAAPRGVVVLLDEIDKGDSSVPNGLLEGLGNRQFTSPTGDLVRCDSVPPLVVVTTNEERSLPDAFLRRCLVLQMEVPGKEAGLLKWLKKRGRAHFGQEELADEILSEAAKMLAVDRAAAQRRGLSPPGGAEYLDLLRALFYLGGSTRERETLLGEIREFTFQKHPSEDVAG